MTVQIAQLDISEVLVACPKKFEDARGFFSETYNARKFSDAGIGCTFVQDNHAFSANRLTLRGLHFQVPPFAQDKLVRVLRGSILDVAVDLRSGSPTFGQHVCEVISAEAWNQIFVPKGFAHGLLTLEPNTEVLYKVSDYYAPDHERGIVWDDPDLAIEWGVSAEQIFISDKDRELPRLAALDHYFSYQD